MRVEDNSAFVKLHGKREEEGRSNELSSWLSFICFGSNFVVTLGQAAAFS